MNRQEGIEKNLIQLASAIASLMTPGIPVSDKAAVIAKLNAAATAKTYDSSKDPLLLPIHGTYVNMSDGASFTFNHNMGYIPIITIVHGTANGDHFIYITNLTETQCTLYHSNPGGKFSNS